MLETLTAADFQARVDQTFRLVPEGGEPFDAVLSEVAEHGGEPPEGHRAPFSAFFTAPGSAVEQGIFTVEHTDLGSLELFLVSVQQDAGAEGVLYEAVFG